MATQQIDFFIAGSERSGTTLTGTLLDQMPELCAVQATMIMTRLANLYAMIRRVQKQGGQFDDIDPALCETLLDFVSNVRVTPFLHKAYYNFCFYENLVNSSRSDVTKDILSQKAYVEEFDFERYLARYDENDGSWTTTVRAMYDEFVAASGSTGHIYGEQTPDNGLRVTSIAKLFPKTKFLFMVRHPITNVASLYDRYGKVDYATGLYRNPFAHSPFDDESIMERTLFIKFEDILQHKDDTLNSIREHLGLKRLKKSQMKGSHASKVFSKYVGTSVSTDRYYRSLSKVPADLRSTFYQKNHDIADVFYSKEETQALLDYRAEVAA